MSESLAVKYRPKTISEICGQSATVQILENQIENSTFKNAYLFIGASGCGKTTAGRAFANAINKNQGSPIEIDGASYSGVDNIRQLVKDAQERSLSSEYKTYIIDECHSLSTQSWQAFLKCIEEPPKYTIFIFCTTEINKVPATIKNRCQCFMFTKIPLDQIKARLTYISEKENLTVSEDAIDLIAKLANGGMRDAIANLERCSYFSKSIDLKVVTEVLGDYSYDQFIKLTNNLIDGNRMDVLNIISDLENEGTDLKVFIDKYLSFIIDVQKYCIIKDINVTNIPEYLLSAIINLTSLENASQYYDYILDKILKLKLDIKTETSPKAIIMAALLQITRGV